MILKSCQPFVVAYTWKSVARETMLNGEVAYIFGQPSVARMHQQSHGTSNTTTKSASYVANPTYKPLTTSPSANMQHPDL